MSVKMIIVVTGGSIENAERIATTAEEEANAIAAERKGKGLVPAGTPQVQVFS